MEEIKSASSSSAGLAVTLPPPPLTASSSPALSARGSGRDDALILVKCHHRCTLETSDCKLLVPITRYRYARCEGSTLGVSVNRSQSLRNDAPSSKRLVPKRSLHPWVAEGQHRVRFGIYGGPARDWSAAVEWIQMVEELGFDSYWVGDHPVQFPFDCWAHLAALAAVTKRVRLGPLVGCALYRHPVLLARQVADVDRVSGGRVVLGLGVGDARQEFVALGLRYEGARKRQEALEEVVQVVPALWNEQPITFVGKHLEVTEARVEPGPLQQPHVPILIAGGGERVTLRQVAQYADASNFGAGNIIGNAWSPEDVRRKYGVLREHCQAFGRPYESILRTHFNLGFELGKSEQSPMVRSHAPRSASASTASWAAPVMR